MTALLVIASLFLGLTACSDSQSLPARTRGAIASRKEDEGSNSVRQQGSGSPAVARIGKSAREQDGTRGDKSEPPDAPESAATSATEEYWEEFDAVLSDFQNKFGGQKLSPVEVDVQFLAKACRKAGQIASELDNIDDTGVGAEVTEGANRITGALKKIAAIPETQFLGGSLPGEADHSYRAAKFHQYSAEIHRIQAQILMRLIMKAGETSASSL